MNSTPTVFDFKPALDWQQSLVEDVLWNYDYSLGTHLALCSGSVGSGKSLPAAHIAVRHCLEHEGARILLGRKALPDLKDTIFKKVVEHLDDELLTEGVDYWVTENVAKIKFRNGSEIISRSWADRKYKKLGSLELSGAIIEELAENDAEDEKALEFILMRVGRLPHVQDKHGNTISFVICPTNPDEPDHWIHKRLIKKKSPTVHVYYSKLSDNHFLDPSYESNLRANMDPLLARRMLDGEWLSIQSKGIYHAYSDKNRVHGQTYKPDVRFPIQISWDFNIGQGKPMSVVFLQLVGDTFHVFGEVIIEGMRTEESCEEIQATGLLDIPFARFEIDGDSTGKHNDTRNKMDDWSIIEKWLSNYKTKAGKSLNFSMEVMRGNPPIRERHNLVNRYCCNGLGQIRLLVYDGAETVDEGLRLTKFKKGGQLVEDDGPLCPFQHCTTALGYAMHRKVNYDDDAPEPQFL